MSSGFPRDLPPDFEVLESRSAIAAVRRDLAAALAQAGIAGHGELASRCSSLAGRGRLGELTLDGRPYLVRRFRHGGLLRWLTGARFLDRRRPFRELALSTALQRAGISTPVVVAARARRAPILGWWLEIVTPRVDGAFDVGVAIAAIARGDVPARSRRAVVAACGAFVSELHSAGLRHPDLHLRNLLIAADALKAGAPKLWVIDLDRATRSGVLDLGARVASLARLYRDLVRSDREGGVHLERSDLARFLRAYEPDRARRRRLWRAIERVFVRGRALHSLSWALERRFGRRSPPA
jgi:tRNA A-37 threonylcarbamoyl transferase component Bud32